MQACNPKSGKGYLINDYLKKVFVITYQIQSMRE